MRARKREKSKIKSQCDYDVILTTEEARSLLEMDDAVTQQLEGMLRRLGVKSPEVRDDV